MLNLYYKSVLLLLALAYLSSCTPKIIDETLDKSPQVKVLLATLNKIDTLMFTNSYFLVSEEARYELGERNNKLIIEPIKDGIHLFNENRNLLYRNHFPIILQPANENHHFIFRGRAYSGTIIFIPTTDNSIHLINKLPIEDYLKGVVPAEIYATKQDYYQAVKAQAICARTYALEKLENPSGLPYDLVASVSDQVYSGHDKHTRLSDQAVTETRGIVVTFNEKLAPVFYHSTCGGKLEAAQNLWPDKQLTYMQTGIDAVSEVYSCSASPYFRWIENRTIEEFDSSFSAKYGKSMLMNSTIDTVDLNFEMNISSRTSGGRVDEITIAYADTNVTLSGYEVRRFFADASSDYLPSNLFYFSQPNDSTVSIIGAGNGHGVGMCQFGAINMSARDFQYYHILNKYFPGTVLIRKY